MRNLFLAAILLFTQIAIGVETGTANQVLRYPSSSPAGTRPTYGSVNLASSSAVTGTLPTANGGTGQASNWTQYGVVYGSTTTALASTAAGTVGQPLVANTSAAPTFQVLGTAGGGTGQSSNWNANGIIYATSTTALASVSAGSSGQVLMSNGASAPGMQTVPGNTTILKAITFQSFLQTTAYYTFTVSSSSFGAGSTYTNNSSTFTVVYANGVSGNTTLVAYRSSGSNAPSGSGTLTYASGSPTGNITYSSVAANGTYYPTSTSPAPLWIRVRAIGAGGSGAGAGSAGAGSGGNGGNTSFGSSLITANGGNGATAGQNNGGTGGSASCGSANGIAISGSQGGPSSENLGTTGAEVAGGNGGVSALGGAGGGGAPGNAGASAQSNSGSGGGGGGVTGTTANVITGAGGGSGGFADCIITSPSANYIFNVGAGATGGTAGTAGNAGTANSGGGGLWIEEHYQ